MIEDKCWEIGVWLKMHQGQIQSRPPAVTALGRDVIGEKLRLVERGVEFSFGGNVVAVAGRRVTKARSTKVQDDVV